MYHWQRLKLYFRLLLWMSTKTWPTSRVPDGIAWCCNMLWSLFNWCKSLTLQLAKVLNTMTEPATWFTVSVIQGVTVFSPTLFAAHRPSYLTEVFLSLMQLQKDFISLLCCLTLFYLVVFLRHFWHIDQLRMVFSS